MRARFVALLMLLALPLHGAAEKWYEAYHRGVAAVNAKNYRDGAAALQRAISEMPNEGTGLRAGRELITYTPHFWLGIAKFNLGDVDGAMREWRVSEEQGVITRTEYYATLKNWVARAEVEKQRNAESAVTAPRKAADAALSRALEMQLAALRAGGDRTESYLQAQRKLQEGRARFQKGGTDAAIYREAETIAQQAIALFASAADEGKRLKEARPAVVPQPKKPQQPKVIEIAVPVEDAPKTTNPPASATTTVAPATVTAPPTPVESEARVEARLAIQAYRRNAIAAPRGLGRNDVREAETLRRRLDVATADAAFVQLTREARQRDADLAARIATPVAPAPAAAPPPAVRTDLTPAYRAYAAGDLNTAERLLSEVLLREPAPEAYLLRGCTRYTRAMLTRNGESQLGAATEDFRAALQRNGRLRLDPNAFSPKLIAYFEQIRVAQR